ncbi:hypothetical protein BaRGS_00010388 [Batillaria attramentaria]|uniref:Uncharacterized protein n=1 Tax=Batillaria attramentaria TaxID=370345 RepID=A0ABD0LFR6_9CAEN
MRAKRKKVEKKPARRRREESPVKFRLAGSSDELVSPSSSRSTHCTPSQHMRRHRARYLQLLMDGLTWLTNKRTRGAQMSMSKSSVGSTGPAAQPGNSKTNVNQTKPGSQQNPNKGARRAGRLAAGRPPTGRSAKSAANRQGRQQSTGRSGKSAAGRPGRPPKSGPIKQRLRGVRRSSVRSQDLKLSRIYIVQSPVTGVGARAHEATKAGGEELEGSQPGDDEHVDVHLLDDPDAFKAVPPPDVPKGRDAVHAPAAGDDPPPAVLENQFPAARVGHLAAAVLQNQPPAARNKNNPPPVLENQAPGEPED